MKQTDTTVAAPYPDVLGVGLVRLRRTLTQYYRLTKPGIVYSNVMTAVAGYLFASRWQVRLSVFGGLVVGTGLLIAASCVLNNYLDRRIDAKMSRTRRRASVTGAISLPAGMVFATVLLGLGCGALLLTNSLTIVVGALAVVSYVAFYGAAKRWSVHGTLVGTIPGAAALVAGYAAVAGRLDVTALGLFLIMVVWQMAHFYAISIFRRTEYAAAGLPVRSVSKGVPNTVQHIVAYVIVFTLGAPLFALVGHLGWFYAAVMLGVGLLWLRVAVRGFTAQDTAVWARRSFGLSLVTLLVFSLALPLGVLLP